MYIVIIIMHIPVYVVLHPLNARRAGSHTIIPCCRYIIYVHVGKYLRAGRTVYKVTYRSIVARQLQLKNRIVKKLQSIDLQSVGTPRTNQKRAGTTSQRRVSYRGMMVVVACPEMFSQTFTSYYNCATKNPYAKQLGVERK